MNLLAAVALADAVEPAGAMDGSPSPTAATAPWRPERLQQLLARLALVDDHARVVEINRFFNRLPHRSDEEQWGQEDYWATPAEFLARGGGDCEDYAIAKYFALRSLGLGDDRLTIAYSHDLEQGVPHMVLLVVPAGEVESVVLDNREPRVLPRSLRVDLVPVYGFNMSAVFVPATRKSRKRQLIAQRPGRWEEMLARRRALVQ